MREMNNNGKPVPAGDAGGGKVTVKYKGDHAGAVYFRREVTKKDGFEADYAWGSDNGFEVEMSRADAEKLRETDAKDFTFSGLE